MFTQTNNTCLVGCTSNWCCSWLQQLKENAQCDTIFILHCKLTEVASACLHVLMFVLWYANFVFSALSYYYTYYTISFILFISILSYYIIYHYCLLVKLLILYKTLKIFFPIFWGDMECIDRIPTNLNREVHFGF